MSAYEALEHPDFRAFMSMRLCATLATQMMSISVSWYVYDLTNDPLMLGFIGLVEAIPSILISLYAGHLADKLNRWKIIQYCLLVLFLCGISLAGLAHFAAHFHQSSVLFGVFTAVFFTGLGRGMLGPSVFSLLPTLVPLEKLANAITWNSSVWQVGGITGLGLGGLIYGTFGIVVTFCVLSLLFFVAIVSHFFIKTRLTPASDPTISAVQRIKEGLRFVRGNRLLLDSMIMDMLAVLLGGAVALLPVFVKEVLHEGPSALGFLRAAVSLGAILTAFFIAHRRPGKNAGRILLGTVAGFGLSIIGFGLSQSFWVAFLFLFLSGAFDEISVYIRAALAQFLTPNEMKGRVASINRIFITSSNEIGTFESGLTAKLMGTVPAILFGGVMCLGIVGATFLFSKSLRNLNLAEMERDIASG